MLGWLQVVLLWAGIFVVNVRLLELGVWLACLGLPLAAQRGWSLAFPLVPVVLTATDSFLTSLLLGV